MNSFLSYLGGKSKLANRIVSMIPEHTGYCEVFAGASWLFFKKEESEVEIINDINADLVTLYRVVKHHLDEFIRYFRWILVSREEFERFKQTPPDVLTDIQRAARFYFLLKTGFAAKITSPSFSISPLRRSNFNLLRIEEELSAVHLRLARAYIENKPYGYVIARFDRPTTFFYIDPPYYRCENDYGKGIFSRDDFEKLRDLLRTVKGKFIMSINDVPEIRALYKEFRIQSVTTQYSAGKTGAKKGMRELLIMNFKPRAR
ncbi:MAG: Dam family site-specific DNA-(adenine-N6)-methyltransferase [Nitrospirae bacterium]|nr:Dam family site-specific DNA-(adenine-N6)-methyltransferase [Nitrospirota bacterium]